MDNERVSLPLLLWWRFSESEDRGSIRHPPISCSDFKSIGWNCHSWHLNNSRGGGRGADVVWNFWGPKRARGKSTTIRMILQSRLVRLQGRGDLRAVAEKGRSQGTGEGRRVVEKPAFYGHSPHCATWRPGGLAEARNPPANHGTDGAGRARRPCRRPVKTISHGMNQRLGLALILLNDPQLVILESPHRARLRKG